MLNVLSNASNFIDFVISLLPCLPVLMSFDKSIELLGMTRVFIQTFLIPNFLRKPVHIVGYGSVECIRCVFGKCNMFRHTRHTVVLQ